MTGEVIWPHSAYPEGASGEIFPYLFVGTGGNASPSEEGLGVASAPDLGADRVWALRFMMPTTLPSGTATLRVMALANIQAGDLSVDPSWASVAVDEEPSAATLNAEGPDPDARTGGDGSDGDNSTFGWATADDGKYIEARWDLNNGGTPQAGEMVVMALRIDDTDTDVLAEVALYPTIIFV